MKKIRVLSLFDGMSCGQIALRDMGVDFSYWASEIDKHAIKQSYHVFPEMVHLGDVSKWRDWEIDWDFDLVLAGSPCQGFSFAGKQLAFDDPRSALFFVFVEILEHVRKFNPNVLFLLENVKMEKKHQAVITKYMDVTPVEINSALVSAQNRKRLYWCNFGVEVQYDMFRKGLEIPQPKDRGIFLKDVVEEEVDEKYYLSEKMISYFKNRAANFNGGKVNVRDLNGKASTLTSSMSSCDISDNFVARSTGRNPDNPTSRKSGLDTEQMLEFRLDGKTNCLTSVQKDNYLVFAKGYEQDNRAYFMDGKSGTVDVKPYRQKVVDIEGIRKLTPTECARLQTIPEWYEWVVSNTQIYRMLGNGWTIEVIKHVLSFALKTLKI